MANHDLFAYLLAGVLALWGLATNPFERWAYRGGAHPSRKLLGYGATILCSWALTALAVGIYGWSPLLIAPSTVPAIDAPLLVPVLTAFFVLALLPIVQSLRGLRWRRAYGAAIRRELAGISGFVPGNAAEGVAWVVFSLTAAVCEEVLFRGFLIRFLHEGGLALPMVGALAVSSLCFGLGHAYQGWKGVRGTMIGGFAFGLLFLVSGNLVPCIVLHALMDLQILYVVRPIPQPTAVAMET